YSSCFSSAENGNCRQTRFITSVGSACPHARECGRDRPGTASSNLPVAPSNVSECTAITRTSARVLETVRSTRELEVLGERNVERGRHLRPAGGSIVDRELASEVRRVIGL